MRFVWLLAALLAAPAQATLTKTFAAVAAEDGVTGSLATATFDSTGYTHVVVSFKHEGAATTLTPSDNKSSTGWVSLTKESHTNGDLHGQMYYAPIGTPGTGHIVTITLGANRDWKIMLVWLVNASDGNGVELDDETFAEGTSNAPDAGSLDTTGAAVVSFFAVAPYASGSYTATGWSEDHDGAVDSVSGYGSSRGPETTSPIDPAASWSSNNAWCATALSLREPAGGGGAVVPIFHNQQAANHEFWLPGLVANAR